MKLIDDPWAQLFIFVALLSAAMTAHGLVVGRRLLPARQTPPSRTAESMPPGIAGAGRRQPKKPGHWIVAALSPGAPPGPDVDASRIGEVLASAKDGDVISVRPGNYQENLSIVQSITIAGDGARPSDVVISGAPAFAGSAESAGGAAIAVGSGSLTLRNLTVAGAELGVYVKGPRARALIESCEISGSAESGLWASQGAAVTIKKSRFLENKRAVSAEGKAVVDVSSSEFSRNADYAFYAVSQGEISDTDSHLSGNRKVAALAAGQATLRLNGTRIEGSGRDAVAATDDSMLVVTRAVLSRNAGAGIVVSEGSELHLMRAEVSGNAHCGLSIHGGKAFLDFARVGGNRCGVAFAGKGALQSNDGDFQGNRKGPLLYSEEFKSEIFLKGERNAPQDFQDLFR